MSGAQGRWAGQGGFIGRTLGSKVLGFGAQCLGRKVRGAGRGALGGARGLGGGRGWAARGARDRRAPRPGRRPFFRRPRRGARGRPVDHFIARRPFYRRNGQGQWPFYQARQPVDHFIARRPFSRLFIKPRQRARRRAPFYRPGSP